MQKIEEFRSFMRQINVDTFMLNTRDEYLNACSKQLAQLCGFTGTNGLLIITKDYKCPFFTDGRYITQAHNQLDQSNFQIYNIQEKNPYEWAKANLTSDTTLGYYSQYFTIKDIRKYENICRLMPCSIKKERDYKKQVVVLHDIKYSGESSKNKCEKLAKVMDKEADAMFLTDLNSISWLLNLRNENAQYTPHIFGHAILYKNGNTDLFIQDKKHATIEANLDTHINTFDASELENALQKLSSIIIESSTTSMSIMAIIKDKHIIERENLCSLYQAVKNKTEIDGARNAHIKDGAAITNFLYWLIDKEITELEAEEKILEYRKEQALFKQPSFPTISAFNENGAIVHYRSSKETNKVIQKDGIYLIDSGGQYIDGTTDVTRTVAIGNQAGEQIKHYTIVLKAHIAIANAIFPQGTTAGELDILARIHLWKYNMDYMHGTGHGVGSYLSVHEGPQSISKGNKVKLVPGMILSNEPGYYIPEKYGIRIENLMYVDTHEDDFLYFKQLTCIPYDKKLMDIHMLTQTEIDWINDYHKFVYESLENRVEDKEWLREMCSQLK
ncbi:MAG: putative dipeptidase PepE [Wolbachia endosymbiont of Ctenocephalides orientis wCori]|nr:MAG: putative dipeptidase PepE [Wolbachia endosymbiont of Ctenocephalides orientis wCori]